MSELEALRKQVARERRAREEAEELLESRAAELHAKNVELAEQTEQWRASETRLREILNSSNDAYVATDPSGIIVDWSDRAMALFGHTAEEAIGRNLEDLLLPDLDSGGNPLQYLLSKQPNGRRVESEAYCKDGNLLPVEFSISPMIFDGQFIMNAFVHDITLRRNVQVQLSHSQKMESVGQLAAGIAHEINTPTQYVGDNSRFLQESFEDIDRLLVAYQGLLEAAKEGNSTAETSGRIEEIISEVDLEFLREEIPLAVTQAIDGVERIAHIVRAMKEFSHPGVQEKVALDINRAIESTTTVCRNEWKYVADLETEFDESVPMVPCLPSEFNQAVLNLMVNAAHAIKDRLGEGATEKGSIKVATRLVDEMVEVRVSDSGTGIPEKIRAKIFDPFFTTKGVGKGTGQGLAIVYSAVVEKHKGQIDVESVVGEGTTFILRFPCGDASKAKEEVSDEECAVC